MKAKALLIGILFAMPIYVALDRDEEYTDIPTWTIGDEWVYQADVYYASPNGSFDGTVYNLTTKVIEITSIEINGILYDVYHLNITGDIEGTISYNVIQGDLEGEIHGSMWIRRADLSTVKTEVFSNGVIHYLIFDYNYEAEATTIFEPPAEGFDFPIFVNESWNHSYNSSVNGRIEIEGIVNETFNETRRIEGETFCIGKEWVTVPAGTFNCLHIVDESGTNETWYSPIVKNVVKSSMVSYGNITTDIDMELISYSLMQQPIDISLEIDPFIAFVGENVTISGVASLNGQPIANREVTIKMPVIGAIWQAITDENGSYELHINAPAFTDATYSSSEMGSDGIIVNISYNLLNGYKVKTLVVKSPYLSFTFNLPEGWNFITLPLKNDYTASTLYQDIPYCSIVMKWNASKGDFDLYVPGSPYDFAIEDGVGYFIAVTQNSSLYLEGVAIESVNVTLYVGWNALGWFKENVTHASSLYTNITACTILLKWNTSQGNFDLYVPGSPYDFEIRQGEGFLVAVEQASEWHGEG